MPKPTSEEQCLGGTCFVDLGDDIGVEACEECEPFRFGKGGFIVFDFRRARSHPLGPTITSRLPGRIEMYTWVKARVKVLLLLSAAHKSFYGKVFVRWPDQRLTADTFEPRGTT